MLAEKLDMSPEHAERWIVNLIRNARLDAKIDSEKVTIYSSGFFHCLPHLVLTGSLGRTIYN